VSGAPAAPVDSKEETREDLGVIAIGLLIYLLSAPLVWLHYLLLALPATLFILQNEKNPNQTDKSPWLKDLGLPLLIFLCLSVNPLRILFQINLKIHLAVITSVSINIAFFLLLNNPRKKGVANIDKISPPCET